MEGSWARLGALRTGLGWRPRDHSRRPGENWRQPGCGVRRVFTCWFWKLGEGAAGAGPGRDGPMGRGRSTDCYISPGRWRGLGPGYSSVSEQWKALVGADAAQGQFGAQGQDRDVKMPAAADSTGSDRPRPSRRSLPGLRPPATRCRQFDSAPFWT